MKINLDNLEENQSLKQNNLEIEIINKMQRQVDCCACQKAFAIKFVNSSREYGRKHNWFY